MHLMKTILYFEARRLLRQPSMIFSLLLFAVVSLYGIRSGNQTTDRQIVQLDSMRHAYQLDHHDVLAKAMDTTNKIQSLSARVPEVVNHRIPPLLVWPPKPLAPLSLGVSDIQPFHEQLKTAVEIVEQPNVPVSNPFKLFAGNFDLSFVLVYLLPLLIIVFCYPVYAEEKESGTLPMLSVQGASLHFIIVYKLLFRFLLIAVVVSLLDLAAFRMAAGTAPLHGSEAALWWLVSMLYTLVWVSLSFFVIALRTSSSSAALLLAGAWLLLLLVWPSLGNMFVSLQYPVPLRDDISSYRRHVTEDVWASNPKAVVDSFKANNPQYISLIDASRDTLPRSKQFVAGYYDLVERRVRRAVATVEQAIDSRNRAMEQISQWNPVLYTQQQFNILAGTNMEGYREFKKQSALFQRKWQAFIYSFQLPDKKLNIDDLRNLPKFEVNRTTVPAGKILKGCILPAILIVLLWLCGFYIFCKRSNA